MKETTDMSFVLGKHLIIDLYECDRLKINDKNNIMNILHNTVTHIGAKLISEGLKEFCPLGISAFAIISESHISIIHGQSIIMWQLIFSRAIKK